MSWCGALYSTFGAWDFGLNWLGDSFGVPAGSDLLNVTDGKATFAASTENYKEFIKWLHELYAEGLLDETGFSQTADQYKACLLYTSHRESRNRMFRLFLVVGCFWSLNGKFHKSILYVSGGRKNLKIIYRIWNIYFSPPGILVAMKQPGG